MALWILPGLVVALIVARYAIGAGDRRRLRALRAAEGEDGTWWDGRTDVWRYDRHHWGWGWRP